MWDPTRPRGEDPDPHFPWELTEEDRDFLRTNRIDPEQYETPYPDERESDGA